MLSILPFSRSSECLHSRGGRQPRTPTRSDSRHVMGILERSQSPHSLPRGARVGEGEWRLLQCTGQGVRPSFCGGSSRARAAYAASRTKRTVAQQYGLCLAHHKTVRHYSLDDCVICQPCTANLHPPSEQVEQLWSNLANVQLLTITTYLQRARHIRHHRIRMLDLLNSDHPPAATPCPCGTCLRDILGLKQS